MHLFFVRQNHKMDIDAIIVLENALCVAWYVQTQVMQTVWSNFQPCTNRPLLHRPLTDQEVGREL